MNYDLTNNVIMWGEVIVFDKKRFKDVIIIGNSYHIWDWKKTGTTDKTGVLLDDFDAYLTKEIHIIVFATGFHGRLHVSAALISYLTKIGKTVYVDTSFEAMKIYNNLVAIYPNNIIGIFHSTC